MPDRTQLARGAGWLALATVFALTLAGCGQPTSGTVGPRATSVNSQTPSVTEVVRPQSKTLRRVVEQPGAVHAYEETHLFARVPGYVGKVRFDVGQKVRGPKYDGEKEIEAGEVLAELSVPELVAEAGQKQALVRQAEADVEQAKKAHAAAEANVGTTEASVVEAKASEARWGSESQRIAKMVQQGVIDVQTREETRNQHKAAAARVLGAEAMVTKAKADRDKAAADVRSAEARVDVAKADARRTEAMLGYSKIRAPFDGVVTMRKVNTGDLVQPAAGKGDWLFVVDRLDPVRVVIDVPEADAALVDEKSQVILTIPALQRPALTASVTRTSWALAPTARTLRAEVDLPNKDGKLRPGLYVSARLTGEQVVGWALPSSALVRQGDATVCFLIENGKAVRTPVQAGRNDGQFTEVLKLQKAGTAAWIDWTGKEEVAAKAAGLSDGQTVASH